MYLFLEYSLDLNVTEIKSQIKSLGKGRGVQFLASISKDKLTEMSWYKFAVIAANENGETVQNVEMQVLGAPTGCKQRFPLTSWTICIAS